MDRNIDTGLDRSIPHIGVIMVKPDAGHYPRYPLSDGYSFRRYAPGDEQAWARIHVEVGQFKDMEEALNTFHREFLGGVDDAESKDTSAVEVNMWYITDPNGEPVATGSIWDGDHFGVTRKRLHWIAVSPRHQGKGLAKALLTQLLDVYREMDRPEPPYLTSQTWSYRALNLYMRFGFEPYLGEKPANWQSANLTSGNFEPWDFDEKNREAWAMIREKIDGRTS